MATKGGRIEFQVGLNVETKSIQSLKTTLQNLQKIRPVDFSGTRDELKEVQKTAAQVEEALKKAFNVNLGSLNIGKFNTELQQIDGGLDGIYRQFSKLGGQGQTAFSEIAKTALTSNFQLKETNSLIQQMGTTLVNTIKWNIASSAINSFTQGVQSAFTYVKSLDAALTDIRIVTGDSQQKMQQFAASANKAAQSLGRSTMDYTKSALTFYQQGLNDEDVQARTEAVLKAQNITGTGSEMADYMTAVWNGYKVANEEAELYVDKLASVADSSASDMSQLAIAMSRVASTASNMGVDIDQLNAQIATVVATTRQAPESVGTAFKTIYTRLNDIKTGADEAEISLGNYSGKMASIGFNVLDTNGRLRDTGQIMEEIGERWKTLTKEQQIYLASTMGGQRQVNQLMALFNNWTTYSDLLNISLESEGTLAEKNSRYMESLGAKMNQLAAAQQHVKSAMVDTDSWKAVLEILTAITDLFGTFVDSIGGGGTALLAFGSILMQVFSGPISQQLNNIVTNLQKVKENAKMKEEDIAMTRLFGESQGYKENQGTQAMVDAKKEIQQYYSFISAEQANAYNEIVKQIGATKQQVAQTENLQKQVQIFQDGITAAGNKVGSSFTTALINAVDVTEQLSERIKNVSIKNFQTNPADGTTFYKELLQQLESVIGTSNAAIPALSTLQELVRKGSIDFGALQVAARNALGQTQNLLNKDVQEVNASVKEAQASFELVNGKKQQFLNGMESQAFARSITQSVAEISRLSSSFMAFGNIFKTFSNDSLSFGEKMSSGLMSLTFVAGSISSVVLPVLQKYNTLKQASIQLSKAQQAQEALESGLKKQLMAEQLAYQAALNGEEETAVVIAAQLTTEEELQAMAKGKDVIATELQAAADAKAAAAKNLHATAAGKLFAVLAAHPWIAVATAVGIIAVAAYHKLTVTVEEAKKKIEQSNQAYETEENKLKSLSSQIQQVNNRIKQLQNNGSLSIVEQEELVKLQATNTQLHEQLKNQQAITEEKKKQIALDTYIKNFEAKSATGAYGEKASINLNNQQDYVSEKEGYSISNKAIDNWLTDSKNGIGLEDTTIEISNLSKLLEIQNKLKNTSAETIGITEEQLQSFKKNIDNLIEQSENFYQTSFQEILKDYHVFQEGLANSSASQVEKAQFQKGLEESKKLLDEYYLNVSKQSESTVAGILKNSTKINQQSFNKLQQDLKETNLQELSDEKIQQFLTSHLNNQDVKNLNTGLDSIGMSAKTLLLILQGSGLDWTGFLNAAQIDQAKTSLESLQNVITLLSEQERGTKLSKKQLQQLQQELAAIGGEYEKLTPQIQILTNTGLSGTELYRHSLELLREELIKQYIASNNLTQAQQNIFSLKDLQIYKKNLKDLFTETYKNQNLIPILQNEIDNGNEHVKYNQDTKTYTYDKEYYNDYIKSLQDNADTIYQNSNYQEEENKLLVELATQYNNCTLEILNYDKALNDLNNKSILTDQTLRKKAEILKTNSELSLEASIKANQLANRYKLEKDQVVDLTRTYIELAKEKNNGTLTEGVALGAASEAAGFIQQNRGIADLKDHYYDLLPVLKKVGEATDDTFNTTMKDIKSGSLKKQFKQLKSILADIAHVTEDQIDDKWLKTYAEDLQKIATNNDEQALARIQQGMQFTTGLENMGISVDMDQFNAALDTAYDSVAEWASTLPEGELTLDQLAIINQLAALMQEAGYTVGEIQDFFSQAHIRLNFSDTKEAMQYMSQEAAETAGNVAKAFTFRTKRETLTDKVTDYSEIPTGYTAQLVPEEKEYSLFGGVIPSTDGMSVTPAEPITGTTKVWSLHFTKDATPEAQEQESSQTAFGQTVESAFNQAPKPPAGGISEDNKTRNLGGGGKKGGGGKGGGGKEQKPTKAKRGQPNREARYHNVNKKISSLDKNLSNLGKKRQKVYGSASVKKALDEELDVLQKQLDAEKEKRDIVRDEQKELQELLKAQQDSLTFDPITGQITNYAEAYKQAEGALDALADKWDSMSKEQQDAYKEEYEETKKKWEDHLKLIERYVTLEDRYRDSLQKSAETEEQIFQKKIEKFKVSIDYHIDYSEALRDWRDFEDKVIDQLRDDDIFGNIESRFKNIFTYFDENDIGKSLVGDLTDQVNGTLDQIKKMKNGVSQIYGNNMAQAMQDLDKYTKQLMSSLTSVKDLMEEIKQSFFDLVNKAQESFDEQTDEYEALASWIEHDRRLMELLYGDEAYEKFQKFDQKQAETNLKQLDFYQKQKDFWWEQMEVQKARMDQLDKQSNAYKEAEKRFKELEKHWLDTAKTLNSTIEDSIDNLIVKYENTINKIFGDLDKKLTDNKGLDPLAEEWELINKEADQYLDDVNALFEIEKLGDAYKDALKANEGNAKVQNSLNKMMNEQLGMLKDKDKLTQYDVDRANKLLEIELKRIALEEARQNKTRLRLKRDSQGNYSYQFTADEEETDSKRQELAAARNELYNMDKQQYKNNLDEIIALTQQAMDRIKQLYLEGKDDQAQALAARYNNIIGNLTDQNGDIKDNLQDSAFDELSDLYDKNKQEFLDMSDAEKDQLMNGLVPQWDSGVQAMSDKFAGNGGFLPTCQDAFNQLADATKEYKDDLKDLEDTAKVNFEQIEAGINDTAEKTETLIEDNQQLIETYEDQFETMEEVIDQLADLAESYRDMRDAVAEATQNVLELKRAIAMDPQSYSNKDEDNNTDKEVSNKPGNRTFIQTPIKAYAENVIVDSDPGIVQPSSQGSLNSSEITSTVSSAPIRRKVRRISTSTGFKGAFATGGYTGSWGDEGKLAILHEKELVLNKDDTANILAAVSLMRHINSALNPALSNLNIPSLPSASSNATSVDQQVHIQASFPNVQDHNEIEQAFNNLINRASQYAFNTDR